MRLNSSVVLLLGLHVAMACSSVGAAELQDLPRCERSIKIIHTELAPLQTEHPGAGRVELEFTIDALGYVSDPAVVQSTVPRLNKEALKSVVLWRYVPPSSRCRHRTSITYELKDAEDA
jgi:TonB family protein